MEVLKGLSPETIIVVGILWILREVFGFVTKLTKRSPSENSFIDTMKHIADHIDAQTELVRDLSYEIRILQKDVARVSEDVQKLQRRNGAALDRI